jgi:methylated-DNA-[protein]-cysteine S-methyltransferase
MEITISACRTAWGWVGIAASSAGLLGTTLPAISQEKALAPLLHRWPSAQEGMNPFLAALQEKLRRYFDGESVDFWDEALDVRNATEFRTLVWNVVRSIPRGQIRSYSWVAAQSGSPRGARAVGRVMATNPFPIVVPCHRVVGQDGQLTGFGGGLDMKRRLLELEAATRPTRSV